MFIYLRLLQSIMKFSRAEVGEIVKAWFITSLAFAIVITVRREGIAGTLSTAIITPFIISMFAVGLGVVLHELGHKYFGQKYGGESRFKAFDKLLFIGVLLAFSGFLFVLPGAVFTKNNISRRQLGIIALAGPAVNFILGFLFLPLLRTSGILFAIGQMGVEINFLLAAFNMIPVGLFDGYKVFSWNKAVWAVGFIASISCLFFVYAFL